MPTFNQLVRKGRAQSREAYVLLYVLPLLKNRTPHLEKSLVCVLQTATK